MQNEFRMNQHIFFNFRKNNGTRNISRSASFNNAANDFSEVTFSRFSIKVGYFFALLYDGKILWATKMTKWEDDIRPSNDFRGSGKLNDCFVKHTVIKNTIIWEDPPYMSFSTNGDFWYFISTICSKWPFRDFV